MRYTAMQGASVTASAAFLIAIIGLSMDVVGLWCLKMVHSELASKEVFGAGCQAVSTHATIFLLQECNVLQC